MYMQILTHIHIYALIPAKFHTVVVFKYGVATILRLLKIPGLFCRI